MPQELMPWEDQPAPASRSKEAMPWEDSVPSVTSRVVRYDMPEPPGAPKIAVEPVPVPPGFGQRVYEQTLQSPVELVKGMWNDPKGTLMKTLASMTATQIQGVQNPMRIQPASPVTPIIEDVRSGNLSGAAGGITGLGLTLASPKILSKVPGAAKVTGAGVRAAAPDVAIGTAKVGAGYAMEHMLPGAGYLKYAVELPTAYSGAKQIGRGLKKGVIAGREALKARAAAAAEALAAERAAAAETAGPGQVALIPEERRIAPSTDTSYVRAVPADPLPPSRQLTAPAPPAIVTPAPELPPDASYVRAVRAPLPEVIPPTLRTNEAALDAARQMREAMGLGPEDFRPPTADAPDFAAITRGGQLDRMARKLQEAGIDAQDAAKLDPPDLAAVAKAAGIEGSLGIVSRDVVARLQELEKPVKKAAVRKTPARVVEPVPTPAAPAVTPEAAALGEMLPEFRTPAGETAAAAPNASARRVKAVSKWLAEGEIGTELVARLETDAGARKLLDEQSRRLGHRSIGPGEIPQIVEEVKRLRAISENVPDVELIYRGEGGTSTKNGPFWSPDPDWAAQFTQTGEVSTLKRAGIRRNAIYEPETLPYAGDPDAVAAAVKEARSKGFKAIRLDEGAREPKSVYVFDRSALEPTVKPTRKANR